MNFNLRILILFTLPLFLVTSSCGKLKNSSSNDPSAFSTTVIGSAQFKSAFAIIGKNCTVCHSAWSVYSEADFITNGLVVSNDPTLSSIYYRLINNDSGITGDMPLSGSALTSDEISTIKSWVQVAAP